MAIKLQLRRDTSANWSAANPVLAEGEVGIDTTLVQAKIGNGVDAWDDLPFGFIGTASGDLLAANNLSDVADVATARTNLGLGSLATLSTVNNGNWSGTDLAVANGGTGASTAQAAQVNLKLYGMAIAISSKLYLP